MENKERQNLNLTGNGTVAGGVYNNVKIIGEETIHGDVDCISLKLTGTCDIRGNVQARTAKLVGTAEIKGNLKAEELTVVGNINIDNNIVVKELKITGESKVKGNVLVERVSIFGFLDIDGECTTETFIVKGPFKIGGLLNAGNVDIEMHSKCHVKEIGGERINIRRGTDMLIKKIVKSLYMPRDFYLGQLLTDSIEGDEIYLEYVKVKVVRGNNIEIGPGCEIDLIEYKNTLKQHESSSVGSKRKV
ncbi:cytoskeletal protein CcmA (bactofilin family) [Anaerosolibacter carboniphilus]|uniref:Cytoskeletal protein CcmA (Bactofilin family) n=1 Tax=Anaerosolibacter carboniphilus TaxID=1417629 RepID=A0A841KPL1_9FIRM|nr:bactofilin [Anaerosolibacter carboniphilus]MBB6215377.1 cytoskeletal protein CcmA (bactofilin family) [Anaerosolibacter carboniphilus]